MCAHYNTQSDESKEKSEEEEQAEQKAEEPLPPAAAGAEAKTWTIVDDLWERKNVAIMFFYFAFGKKLRTKDYLSVIIS